jgi:hypothetical protein
MVDVKHTPGPWEIMLTAHGHTIVSREHGWSVASLPDYDPTHEANAAFIVKAVNAHDELVAALKQWADNPDGWNVDQVNHARVLIAKVEA